MPIELKIDKFKQEHLSKLKFYLEIFDYDVKINNENLSVGLFLCVNKDDVIGEYVLSCSMSQAMVAEYTLPLLDKNNMKIKYLKLFC